jgi:subtilisin family serine protease
VYLEETNIYADMDPRLQRVLERRQRGLRTLETAATSSDEIGVIALVRDLQAWRERGDVREGATLGETGAGWLVTARVPIARVEAIRQAETVRSLKAAQPLRPVLSATVPEINATPPQLPDGLLTVGGEQAVVGVVDFGADFAHGNFRRSDGSTRLTAIWDQGGPTDPGSPFGYGRRHNAAAIDAALLTTDPYLTLGYGPRPDTPTSRGSHGTHVMDIAAGNGGGSGVPGVAPRAKLTFVEVAASDITWEGEEVVGSEFGDSVQLLEAIRFLFDEAGTQPCVVNVSLGTNGGPHDGSSLVEQGIDLMVQEQPGRAVVIAASNSFDDGIHAAGSVPAGGAVDLGWEIPPTVAAQSELEVWYPGQDRFNVELLTPDGTSLGSVPLGSNGRIRADDGTTLLFVSHRAADPNNGDNVVGIFLEARVPSGTWTVRLHGEQVSDGAFHAWIERNDQSQSAFAPPHDNTHTLGSISCGRLSLVVGSYDAHKPAKPLSWFSSAGPTRDGREKPEVSAPGHDVLAAHSRTGTGVTRKSGTSMAAPAVTGMAALLLSEAAALGRDLDAAAIRRLVVEAARSDPPVTGGWHDRYGHGRIDAAAALTALAAPGPVEIWTAEDATIDA